MSNVKPLEAAADYYEISGTVSRDMLETETEILVNVNGVTYRAYHMGENAFCVYIKKDVLSLPADIKVFAV